MRIALTFLIATMLVSLSTIAQANPAAKEFIGYQFIIVNLDQKEAKDCNLQDSKGQFEAYLNKALADIQVLQTAEAASAVVLNINNRSFGLIDGHCAIHTTMSFRTNIPSKMLTGLAPRQQAAVDRLGKIEVSLWEATGMAVTPLTQPSGGGESVAAIQMVEKMIDGMVNILKEQRQ